MKSAVHTFQAVIYKTGINFAVDVPHTITNQLKAVKGYIRIKGTVNGAAFTKSLVPVKNSPYRLFVNMITLREARTQAGKRAVFVIEQDHTPIEKDYEMPAWLQQKLTRLKLSDAFQQLTPSRRRDILRYLSSLKQEETIQRNVAKLIEQLRRGEKNTRIP